MITNVQILVPPKWTNDQKGKFFEELTAQLFRKMRFSVTQRVRFTGMEIDVLAINEDNREVACIECKFHKDTIDALVVKNRNCSGF